MLSTGKTPSVSEVFVWPCIARRAADRKTAQQSDAAGDKKNKPLGPVFRYMAGVERIELSKTVLETVIIPFNYTPTLNVFMTFLV